MQLKGYTLWSERYDRSVKDIFALEDEITMKILTEIRVKLTEGEAARMYAKGTHNLQAYLKVLEGDGYFSQFNKESNDRGHTALPRSHCPGSTLRNGLYPVYLCHSRTVCFSVPANRLKRHSPKL